MGVKTKIVNGLIEKEVYIEQPKCFETFDRDSYVSKIKKVVYGIKQAPCASYTRIDS